MRVADNCRFLVHVRQQFLLEVEESADLGMKYQLKFLRNTVRFTWSQMTGMLLVSRTTLWRRVQNLESFSNSYTTMSDAELDELIRAIRGGFPNSGISMMLGHLRSRIVNVSVLGQVWFELILLVGL